MSLTNLIRGRARAIVAAATAVTLTGALIGGIGPSALAASTTYDKFGDVYSSSDNGNAYAYNSSSFPKPGYSVRWRPGTDILVGAQLVDAKADGLGATLAIDLVEYTSDGRTTGSTRYYEIRNTEGAGDRYYSKTIPWPDWAGVGIKFRVCNGKSSTRGDLRGNINCGASHGTFRP